MGITVEDRKKTLESLVRAHQARLHTYILSKTGDLHAADDLVQDVFLAAYKALDTFDSSKEALPWLLVITRNLLRERWRALARDRDSQRLRAVVLENELDREETPELFETRIEALRGCVEKLPTHSKDLVSLLYEKHLNCEQVAALWQRDAHVLRNTIYRIRKELRACVERSAAGGLG